LSFVVGSWQDIWRRFVPSTVLVSRKGTEEEVIDYCKNYFIRLQGYGCVVVVQVDNRSEGGLYPPKAHEQAKRKAARNKALSAASTLLTSTSNADKDKLLELRARFVITEELQNAVVDALRKEGVTCVQNHHEADFSLARGLNNRTFDGIISPDGDFIVHCNGMVIYDCNVFDNTCKYICKEISPAWLKVLLTKRKRGEEAITRVKESDARFKDLGLLAAVKIERSASSSHQHRTKRVKRCSEGASSPSIATLSAAAATPSAPLAAATKSVAPTTPWFMHNPNEPVRPQGTLEKVGSKEGYFCKFHGPLKRMGHFVVSGLVFKCKLYEDGSPDAELRMKEFVSYRAKVMKTNAASIRIPTVTPGKSQLSWHKANPAAQQKKK